MNLPEGWPTEEMVKAGINAMHKVTQVGNPYTEAEAASIVFKKMFAVAPTPSAQEDEPFAWLNPSNNVVIDKLRKRQRDGYPQFSVPLYTRPDSKLWKLANEYVEYMYPGADVDRSTVQIMSFLYYYGKNLRAALEDK